MESVESKLGLKYSRCDACNADLDGIEVGVPVYCTPCIEEMGKLGMGLRMFKRHKAALKVQSP